MFYLCVVAALLSSFAFVHTLPIMIYLVPASLCGVLLPPLQVIKGKIDLLHWVVFPLTLVLSIYATFFSYNENWRVASMVFATVYLVAFCRRHLVVLQRRWALEVKKKNDFMALRLARTETIRAFENVLTREKVTLTTTAANEASRLEIARRFARLGWNVRVELLDETSAGRFRIVYTAPASVEVIKSSIRAIRTESFSASSKA